MLFVRPARRPKDYGQTKQNHPLKPVFKNRGFVNKYVVEEVEVICSTNILVRRFKD